MFLFLTATALAAEGVWVHGGVSVATPGPYVLRPALHVGAGLERDVFTVGLDLSASPRAPIEYFPGRRTMQRTDLSLALGRELWDSPHRYDELPRWVVALVISPGVTQRVFRQGEHTIVTSGGAARIEVEARLASGPTLAVGVRWDAVAQTLDLGPRSIEVSRWAGTARLVWRRRGLA